MGEHTADLNYQDVAVDNINNPTRIQLKLSKSKTDVFRQGVTIHLGRTDQKMCPVAALLAWMIRRGNHPGPLFTFASGRPLTRPAFVTKFREALQDAGVDPQGFSGHSFRAGAATTAALKGVSDSHIKQLGRWKSAAYLRYIRPPRQQLAALSKLLGPAEDTIARREVNL